MGESGTRASQIEAVRRFTRFYTRRLGVLKEGLLDSPFSLAEARVLFELAHHDRPIAKQISEELGLDPGYLSRLLKALETRGLLKRSPAADDARQQPILLTEAGEHAFADLNARARAEVGGLLDALSETDRSRLVEALAATRQILGDGPAQRAPYILRPHEPGDLGWVVQRHGALYAHEYGWDETFEGLVAEIVSQFLANYDPRRERCWIAEKEGENVGSVLLVKKTDEVAQLRLLLVEPSARGHGIGRRLVDECVRFARRRGYGKLTLWTNDVLVEARRIYERAGFRLVEEEPHHSFGQDLVGQNWDLDL